MVALLVSDTEAVEVAAGKAADEEGDEEAGEDEAAMLRTEWSALSESRINVGVGVGVGVAIGAGSEVDVVPEFELSAGVSRSDGAWGSGNSHADASKSAPSKRSTVERYCNAYITCRDQMERKMREKSQATRDQEDRQS